MNEQQALIEVLQDAGCALTDAGGYQDLLARIEAALAYAKREAA